MKVFDKAIESRLDRRCTFVALGGGVIGDMCGYAAASYLRGVNFIQIPTTVMAQVFYYPRLFYYILRLSAFNHAFLLNGLDCLLLFLLPFLFSNIFLSFYFKNS